MPVECHPNKTLTPIEISVGKYFRWFELRTVVDTTILKHAEIQVILWGIYKDIIYAHGFSFSNCHQGWEKTSRVSRVFKSYSLLI